MSLVRKPKHEKPKLVDAPVDTSDRTDHDDQVQHDSSKTLAPSNKGSRRKVRSDVSQTASSAHDGQQPADPRGSDLDSKPVQRTRRTSPAKPTGKRPTTDPVDEALAAADYQTLTAEEAMEHIRSTMPTSKLSKQQRALLQEQDRREQYLGEFLDGEVNVSWRVAVIVLLAFIAIAAAKTWADAFMSLSLFMFGYLLHVTITIVRLKRDADV